MGCAGFYGEFSVSEKKLRLDETDYRIITELQKNGRESYKNIARKLNVSDGTVRLRVERMVKNNYLKISASINPLYFENCLVAQVGINLEWRANTDIMKKISEFKGVQSVNNVTGRYDLVVEVFVNSRSELRQFLVEDLSTIPEISSTESFVFLETINKWVALDR